LQFLALDSLRTPIDRGNNVVHDFPLERVHRRKSHRIAAVEHRSSRLRSQRAKFFAPRLTMSAYIKHEPTPGAGLLLDGQPGELLERVQSLAIRADQRLQAGTDDGNDGAVALDVEVDVPSYR
jgi:hypothetical protein